MSYLEINRGDYLFTKKYLHVYREEIRELNKSLNSSFPLLIVKETVDSILEKMECIELLFARKKFNAGRLLVRPTIQMMANLLFILEDSMSFKDRAYAYNAWCIQNIEYKISAFISNSPKSIKDELKNEYEDLLGDKFPGLEIPEFQKYLSLQRDFFNKSKDKRAWYNILEIYQSEEKFIEDVLGQKSTLIYKVYSENVHGNEVIFKISNTSNDYENHLDILASRIIEHSFCRIILSLKKLAIH